MSVATELQRIIDAKDDLKTAIEAKGVTVSSEATLDAYPTLVESIPTGGGVVEEKLLNFIDFDGTIVASYDGSEIAGLSELPSAPDHSQDEVPLTFDEWNWTLAEIQAYHTSFSDSVIVVGANYHTTDGKTHAFFNITTDNDIDGVMFRYGTSTSTTIDWGDGTTETRNSSEITHVYSSAGLFHCIIDTDSNNIQFGTTSDVSSKRSKVVKIFYSNKITNLYSMYGGNGFCTNLQTISIPSSLKSLSGLNSCYSLKALIIPIGTTTVESETFNYCYSLKYIALPNSITSFRNGAIQYCNSLRQLTIPSNATTFGQYAFRENYSLQSIAITSGMSTINNVSFYRCYTLQKVKISNGVTAIGDDVFYYCKSLQSVAIPSSVTSIGAGAFRNCNSMCSVTILATTPPTLANTNAFSTSYQKKIYVPYSADHSILTAYQSASNWSNFASIMEELPE